MNITNNAEQTTGTLTMADLEIGNAVLCTNNNLNSSFNGKYFLVASKYYVDLPGVPKATYLDTFCIQDGFTLSLNSYNTFDFELVTEHNNAATNNTTTLNDLQLGDVINITQYEQDPTVEGYTFSVNGKTSSIVNDETITIVSLIGISLQRSFSITSQNNITFDTVDTWNVTKTTTSQSS